MIYKKGLTYQKGAIKIDTLVLVPNSFQLFNANKEVLDSTYFDFNYNTNLLIFKKEFNDTLTVNYFYLPEFLTKKYVVFDKKQIVPNDDGILLRLQDKKINKTSSLLEGLQTSGSISRAVTLGNNQNTVLNSNLDLQIGGKLSETVAIKASIQDSNIPIQEGGYSQKIDEFDQIFIELSSKNWRIRAGDLFLENRQSNFLNFNKKVQGLLTHVSWESSKASNSIFASAALVRGQYAKSTITPTEGNQGPYKLRGSNNELYVLIISGSENVFINGVVQQRGEDKDYVIDYNAGEIKFNPTKPITSEMRIVVEYQFSERNFSRFLTYNGYERKSNKWKFGTYLYSENDIKNQPLQQSLSQDQIAILQNVGDNQDLMIAPSAFQDTFSENKILYKKVLLPGIEIFQYSNNPLDVLYQVKFLFVGENKGDYKIINSSAIGKIYEYTPPIAGVKQGNFDPIVQLFAPNKLQIVTFSNQLNINNTKIDNEIALSNSDKNLFSSIDDQNNQGIAIKLNIEQQIPFKKIEAKIISKTNWIQQAYQPVERIYTIEFNRDWNLIHSAGNQFFTSNGFEFKNKKKDSLFNNWVVNYHWDKLNYSKDFDGNKHNFNFNFNSKKWLIQSYSSYMSNKNSVSTSQFFRTQSKGVYQYKKLFTGINHRAENVKEINNSTQTLTSITQKFNDMGVFIGRGDTTKVYTQLGYNYRVNDSLKNNILQRVNQSHTSYLKSQLIQNENTQLQLFSSYRILKFTNAKEDLQSINLRLLYNQSYWKQVFQTNILYEIVAGTIAQQEFTFLEVEPTRGVYMWNDYNNNGIQELQEFEIATFPDLAKYIKVFLPNQVFKNSYQNKWSLSFIFNGGALEKVNGFSKFMHKWFNQTVWNIDKKTIRDSNTFQWNPFENEANILGNLLVLKNSLFYNRAKQSNSWVYNYSLSKNKTLLNFGVQEYNSEQHQIQFFHLIKKFWLIQFQASVQQEISLSDSYFSRNFELNGFDLQPKITLQFNTNASLDLFYNYLEKENQLADFETLSQNQWGMNFIYNHANGFTSNGSLSFISNNFSGNVLSPVGFQLLQGLNVGKNYTWNFSLQKNLTEYLDVSVLYQGRKTETSPAVHTGTIQLRAFF